MKARISKEDLLHANQLGILTSEQAERLWSLLMEMDKERPRFSGVNVVHYFGALVIISAMTWFATEAFSEYHAIGLASVSFVYLVGLSFAGYKFYGSAQTRVPGGLLLTAAIFIVPLFVFSVQKHLGYWVFKPPGEYGDYYAWIKSGWFLMELATIAAAISYLGIFRFPFMTFPLAFTAWFLSMDATPIIFGIESFTADQRKTVSMVFGIGMILVAYLLDRRTEKDFSFWLYLFGITAFWTGLTLLESGSELGKFIYFCVNISLLVVSVLLQRKAFIVFGAMGVYAYLYHLSSAVFKNSMMFPVALSLLGLSIVFAGILYQRNEVSITRNFAKLIPESMLRLLPPHRNRRD